jgi:arginine deiminase
MSLGVHSEVGRLHKVIVHRPGLEHQRLSPSAEELCFDGLWLSRAMQEHHAFVAAMRRQGVEVYLAETLLAVALAGAAAREWVCSHILNEREVGVDAAERARSWVVEAGPAQVVELLIGGSTGAAVERAIGLEWPAGDATPMLLPPLSDFLFQRDPSFWIFDGVSISPMTAPARKRESMMMEAIYRFHPMFTNERFPVWLGGVDEDWSGCHVEGGDVQPLGNGTVMIGMGERTTRQAVLIIARELFRSGSATSVLVADLPTSHSHLHLDSVVTMCDRDLVLLFPDVADAIRTWTIRPRDESDDLVVEENDRTLVEAMAAVLGVGEMRVVPTGGDRCEAPGEWAGGNNVIAIEPGVVVAYERNTGSNAALRRAGIEVVTIEGLDLGRGRGGLHGMVCPIEREPAR